MSRLSQILGQLKNTQVEPIWQQLLSEISNRNHAPSDVQQLQQYMRTQCLKPKDFWFKRMGQLVKIAYEKRSQLLKSIYKILPILMMRYIQINYVKYEGLEECLIYIYNQQLRGFNQAQIEKCQLSKDMIIRGLYENHLGKEMLEPKTQALQPIKQINNTLRTNMKSLLFYLVYREACKYPDQFLVDYYRTLFIYCGADQKDINNAGSLYLLEKIHKVSIFRYSITEQELQWIILTLYELCTQVKKDKFELLAVINVIHKKVSNEGLFRVSDIANSLIHLLEDEYSEVFM